MASRDAADSPRSSPRRPAAAAPKDGGRGALISPRFRSAAALAGWDEESVLLAALVVEDTPVRESRRKRRSSTSAGGSAGSNTRKRRSRRQSPGRIPPVVLALDDDDKPDNTADGKKDVKEEEEEKVVVVVEKEASGSGDDAAAAGKLPCMDRLREELSCAICLEVCFEPSTTPCGHSFCMKCLKHYAAKCGKRCPKCRQLISNSRSCTINTVLWNTIQLLFPSEVEARRTSIASSSCNDDVNQSPPRSNSISQGGMRTRNSNGSFITEGRTRSSSRSFVAPSSNTRSSSTTSNFVSTHGGSTRGSNSSTGFVRASQLVTTRRSVRPEQSDDAALAYRLQKQEFMTTFETVEERPPQNTVSTARANLRAMASRAIRLRARGWPL
uniref:RING-type E3 ubiquitin transferase n=1 Tax=Arundo donax TaxID=35708 RepID=A0A0A8XN58_ARUDO